MSDPTRQLQSRFILHLVVALQGRLGYGKIPLTRSFVPLDGTFSAAEPDLGEAKVRLAKIANDWSRQQEQEPLLNDEVRTMITQALKFWPRRSTMYLWSHRLTRTILSASCFSAGTGSWRWI